MKLADLREKSDKELNKELLELGREAFNLRMQMGSSQPVKYSRFKAIRHDVARIKTILNERQRANTV
uniref:Large ribosomal subunit protein uL29 n=1 Tax=Candidatus Kentrum sp. FM TaxID=2126340 RepID=A0A450RX08_9GAMM|nr:MAG: large subunit ribosomal protein L29 [Candidatus Kentron sp. FM]VFJ45612.1 MAG: large subunit ribosomal protein L29 [Candidatus Kentron sp. FM]VFK06958.1 MAG: large subunit ribosomal protein L29 [Candidatus Kentron sp. FM]